MADGASASAFARLWARLLARAYVAGKLTPEHIEEELEPLQARWASVIQSRDLPWYAVEQARRGAFAALVGLTLQPEQRWSALAVGDCCLFQIRDGALVTAMPLSSWEAFNDRPLLLGSRATANAGLRPAGAIVHAEGSWAPGDTFLLMSDALAAAFLRLTHLDFLEPRPRGFRRWVRCMRAGRLLRNDDVSLVWLALPADAAA